MRTFRLYWFVWGQSSLTLLSSLLETVIDLLKHGLAAALKHRQHDALEGVFVGCLDGSLHGLGCRSADCIRRVLTYSTQRYI